MILDYEQKYKEALEKARQLCAYPTTKPFISDLQEIFPELSEPDDEQMWKLIKGYVSNISDLALKTNHITREYLMSWLEKQGEQKPTWKPSDKQMDALNLAIGEANAVDTAAGDEAAEILTSLYEQLKKLKR